MNNNLPPCRITGVFVGQQPSDPDEGDVWIDPTPPQTYIWDGNQWVKFAPAPPPRVSLTKYNKGGYINAGYATSTYNPFGAGTGVFGGLSDYQHAFTDKGDWDFALGSVFAIRGWDLHPEGRLVGQQGNVWLSPEYNATCGNGICERSPGSQCPCGIYAYWSPKRENNQFQGEVVGVVECYGRVVLGDFGVRAEKARMVALVAPTRIHSALTAKAAMAKKLPEKYNVPFYRSIRAMLKEHPLTTPPKAS